MYILCTRLPLGTSISIEFCIHLYMGTGIISLKCTCAHEYLYLMGTGSIQLTPLHNKRPLLVCTTPHSLVTLYHLHFSSNTVSYPSISICHPSVTFPTNNTNYNRSIVTLFIAQTTLENLTSLSPRTPITTIPCANKYVKMGSKVVLTSPLRWLS